MTSWSFRELQDERSLTGLPVSFPDAFRFKGAAPEVQTAQHIVTARGGFVRHDHRCATTACT